MNRKLLIHFVLLVLVGFNSCTLSKNTETKIINDENIYLDKNDDDEIKSHLLIKNVEGGVEITVLKESDWMKFSVYVSDVTSGIDMQLKEINGNKKTFFYPFTEKGKEHTFVLSYMKGNYPQQEECTILAGDGVGNPIKDLFYQMDINAVFRGSDYKDCYLIVNTNATSIFDFVDMNKIRLIRNDYAITSSLGFSVDFGVNNNTGKMTYSYFHFNCNNLNWNDGYYINEKGKELLFNNVFEELKNPLRTNPVNTNYRLSEFDNKYYITSSFSVYSIIDNIGYTFNPKKIEDTVMVSDEYYVRVLSLGKEISKISKKDTLPITNIINLSDINLMSEGKKYIADGFTDKDGNFLDDSYMLSRDITLYVRYKYSYSDGDNLINEFIILNGDKIIQTVGKDGSLIEKKIRLDGSTIEKSFDGNRNLISCESQKNRLIVTTVPNGVEITINTVGLDNWLDGDGWLVERNSGIRVQFIKKDNIHIFYPFTEQGKIADFWVIGIDDSIEIEPTGGIGNPMKKAFFDVNLDVSYNKAVLYVSFDSNAQAANDFFDTQYVIDNNYFVYLDLYVRGEEEYSRAVSYAGIYFTNPKELFPSWMNGREGYYSFEKINKSSIKTYLYDDVNIADFKSFYTELQVRYTDEQYTNFYINGPVSERKSFELK